jgi:L-ascorbate metabolism protein UlaG (beta-lactamase superfamily)
MMQNPNRAIPIHYNDCDVMKSPLSDFKREVKAAGLKDRVRYRSHGETYTFKAWPIVFVLKTPRVMCARTP